MVGLIFLVLWIQEPSAGAYAHSQVQSLFINDARKPTGKVESCRTIGDVDPDQKIWACRVAGQGCVRTFEFVVDHEYGTQPYDNRSSAATDNPCGVKSD